MHRQRLSERAFTLLDISIVLVVAMIFITMATTQYQKVSDRAKMTEAWVNLGSIWKSQALYYAEHGRFAESFDSLMFIPALYYPQGKFVYSGFIGEWDGPPEVAGNDAHWRAEGDKRVQFGGPNGRFLILHYPDGHTEKWENYPFDSGWKRVK
tara:strand:+ start:74 stop:532 length:459 start_codon:yes stop_codon:yes gene_type:complete